MKTKKFTWIICAFILLGSSIFSMDINAKVMIDHEVPTKGSWDPGRRSLIQNPVTVSLNGSLLCIQFKFISPNVTIVVTKGTSVVEQVQISVPGGYIESIDLSLYGSGNDYKVDVFDAFGNHIWGEFTIE